MVMEKYNKNRLLKIEENPADRKAIIFPMSYSESAFVSWTQLHLTVQCIRFQINSSIPEDTGTINCGLIWRYVIFCYYW